MENENPKETPAAAVKMMDAHTLELLEFGKVRELAAGYAASSLGKERARGLHPKSDRRQIENEIGLTTEMVDLLEMRMPPPLAGLRDIRLPLKRCSLGALLEIDQLVDIRGVLELTGYVSDYGQRLGDSHPRMEALLEPVGDFRHLARAIDAAIDSTSKIKDSASPELAAVRRELAHYEERIQAELRRLLRSPEIRKALRFPTPTMCGEHHVLPIAVNYRHVVAGVVHRMSSTGETVYIEPSVIAKISAESTVLKNAEEREIRRVLRRLSDLVRKDAEQIAKAVEILAEVDLLYAKASYSRDYLMTPPVIAAANTLRLRAARHPLLEHLFRSQHREPGAESPPVAPPGRPSAEPARSSGDGPNQTETRAVVPVSVHLGVDFDLLIITGPNTGGKTVALKTVGLLAIMALSGMHIPAAAGSEVPILSGVLADIGDEQSLEQSLSTFSSHVKRIAEILRSSGSSTLVLLDELGAGTEPSEGAALGRAILDELISLQCLAMVTTHLNDLKTYALSARRAENAAMEFDANTLRPTYQLHIGQFGQSCALKIARRLELPRPLIGRAYKYLRRRRGRHAEEFAQLQQLRQEAERARQQALDSKSQAEAAADLFRKKSEQILREEELKKAIETARAALRPGDEVRVTRFDKPGKIIRVDHKRKIAAVLVGAVEWELKLEELVPSAAVRV